MLKDQFAQLCIDTLRRLGETGAIRYEAETFSLIVSNEDESDEMVMGLFTPYRSCENAPAQKHAEIIEYCMRSVRWHDELPQDYASARTRLGMALKHVSFLQFHLDLAGARGVPPTAPRLIHKRVTDELVLYLVFDDGHTLRFLKETDLVKWRRSPEVALSDAFSNLARVPWKIAKDECVFRSANGDSYDSARLVLSEMLERLPLKGRPVVLVPDRDSLIVTGSEDTKGLLQMAAIGHVQLEEGHQIVSGRPLVREGEEWKVFQPPEQARAGFIHLAQAYDVSVYHAQAAALRSQHRADKVPLTASDLQLFRSAEAGAYESITLWRSGAPTLLPQADRVALLDEARKIVHLAKWEQLYRTLGGRMKRTDLTPPSYRVGHFPTPDEIQAMGASIVDLSRVRGPKRGPMAFRRPMAPG